MIALGLLMALAVPVQAVTFTVDTYIAADDFTYDGDDVVVDGCVVTIDGAHSFASLWVMAGGVVTHTANVSTQQYWLDLTIAGDVTVDVGGMITATEKGYAPGEGIGHGSGSHGSGAGYGGWGGDNISGSQSGGIVYGSATAPLDLGSGGAGTGWGGGGAGGGVVQLAVNGTLSVEGEISADGGDGGSTGGYEGGGGSGGSIYITVGTLAGTGAISANGGDGGVRGSNTGGGGGGGRVAVYYTSDSFTGEIVACGGLSNQGGGAGTIYSKSSTQTWGDLLVNNCGNVGPATPLLESTNTFDSVTVQDIGVLDVPETILLTVEATDLAVANAGGLVVSGQVTSGGGADFGQTVVSAGGVLTVTGTGQLACTTAEVATDGVINVQGAGFDASTIEVLGDGTFVLDTTDTYGTVHVAVDGVVTHTAGVSGFDLTVTGDLTIDAGGAVDAGGKGYGEDEGPGAGIASNCPSGGSYGGLGGRNNNGLQSSTYGSLVTPDVLGSGGAHGGLDCVGGAGGGKIRLTVDGTLLVNGSLRANGSPGQPEGAYGGGGGSGGSIYLTVGTFAGVGTISADGGASGKPTCGSGGGGGRIAVYYETDSFAGTVTTCGGAGVEYGGAGTIYRKSPTQSWGDLLVDNCGNTGANTPMVAGAYQFDTAKPQYGAVLEIPPDVTLTVEPSVLTLADDGNLLVAGQFVGGGGTGITGIEVETGSALALVNNTLLSCGTVAVSGGALTISEAAHLDCTTVTISFGGALTVGGTGGLDAIDVNVLDGTFILNKTETFTAIHIGSSGVIAHTAGVADFDLTVTGDLTIDAGGAVDAGGKGYGEDEGPGAGIASNCPSGGSYGGLGGRNNNGLQSSTYGSLATPDVLGSGGAHGGLDCVGGAGGGKIRLTVDGTLLVNGSLRANGSPGQPEGAYGGGGGSGGSIYLTAGTLAGVGTISADGGASGKPTCGSGGGGGRIAVYYETDSFAGAMTACGGSGVEYGGAGTIYRKSSTQTWERPPSR